MANARRRPHPFFCAASFSKSSPTRSQLAASTQSRALLDGSRLPPAFGTGLRRRYPSHSQADFFFIVDAKSPARRAGLLGKYGLQARQ